MESKLFGKIEKTTLIHIPIEVVIKTLEAMYFTFSPYVDEVQDIKYLDPWIYDLVISYNEIVKYLPEEFKNEYEVILWKNLYVYFRHFAEQILNCVKLLKVRLYFW